ncbi:hypothetical protein Bca4012_054994 [Brassica carinata]
MDYSCLDDNTSNTSETLSMSKKTLSPSAMRLYRMGSGGSSVVLDLENGVETESRKLPSSKFKGQSRRKFLDGNGKRCESKTEIVNQNDGVSREVLFEKAVTPSDVGKLNRLVIPKQHAEKHFPLPATTVSPSPSSTKGVLINLEDRTGKVWRFRYSYWNSSQSYVLTKGWSRFVKEKNLRAGDVVCFERSTGPDRQLYIDWKVRSGTELINPVQNVVRLFGVNIFSATSNAGPNDVAVEFGGDKKRSREVELLALGCSKKQAIINAL